MAWAAFRMMRSWFADQFAQPVYEWVITEAVATGHLVAPGFFENPLLRQAYCTVMWVGPTAPQVDPLKEAQAAKARIDALLSTRETEAAELTEQEFEEIIAQLRKERELINAAGLDTETVAERISTEPKTPVAPDDATDDDKDDLEDGSDPDKDRKTPRPTDEEAAHV